MKKKIKADETESVKNAESISTFSGSDNSQKIKKISEAVSKTFIDPNLNVFSFQV